MTQLTTLRENLTNFGTPILYDNMLAVPTHCMFPSGAIVVVYIVGGEYELVVSDEGAAIDELSTHNRFLHDPDRFLRKFSRKNGVFVENGKIYSGRIEHDQALAGIIRVANAANEAVRAGFDQIQIRKKRNIRHELQKLLDNSIPKSQMQKGRIVYGKSSRSYKFESAVRLDNDNFVLIDPVFPDANSINSRAIAHFDVKQLSDKRISQRIVYDEAEEWSSSDLNLLQMAATLVPLSKAGESLEKLGVITKALHG